MASTPSVISQTATTSILTTTRTFTWASFSSTAIATTTITANQSSTLISSTTNTGSVFDATAVAGAAGPYPFPQRPPVVTGTIGPSNFKVGFYVMNPQQFGELRSEAASGDCSSPFCAKVAVQSITSAYSFDWQNPPAGSYYVVFFNYGVSSFTITTPFFLVATSTQQQASTVYSATGLVRNL